MPAFVVPGWGNVPSEISAGASLGPDGSTAGHTILIDTNRLMASGNNSNGEIGDNSTQMRETPVSVAYPQ